MQNLSLTDSMSNSDTDTCRSMGMLPRAKQPTPNGIPGPHYNPRQDFDSELTTRSLMFFWRLYMWKIVFYINLQKLIHHMIAFDKIL